MCLGIDKRVRVYGKLIHLVGTLALENGHSVTTRLTPIWGKTSSARHLVMLCPSIWMVTDEPI
jgi:hypothetical protein